MKLVEDYNEIVDNDEQLAIRAQLQQPCRTPTCWTELSERRLEGPDLVRETEEKVRLIKDRLQTTSDRQKSYADLKRHDIEYAVGEKVFLKVSPWKKVLCFDPTHILQVDSVTLDENPTYEEEPVEILAREIRQLRNKEIPLVKVLWRSHSVEEATWEIEESITTSKTDADNCFF
ncbi:unnamed protein product [Cuscuta campestris]|uniref:Chromo domain-containing protein n=1 Tax=Cuscuta campestris TaxID=132261 RepID=A0A484MRY2_9ASTE|nr:unnamed protein product [Cuscuta campestris]